MTPIELFANNLQESSLATALDELGEYLIQQQRFHELFELRKVQLRWKLGLPVDQWHSIDELPAEQGQRLEAGLLEICREIGGHLVRSGDLATGWSYLEPVGDKALIRDLLAEVPDTDENAETLIHILVAAGLDPQRGFQLVLDRFGTCSSITTYETQLAGRPVEIRRGPVDQLVRHVYQELLDNVRRAIAESDRDVAVAGDSSSLVALLESAGWLTEGLNHQIDTTHLASTVKYSRIVVDPGTRDLAIQLAEYGSRLHEDFQYPGTPPFADTYRDTLAFLQALCGTRVDEEVQRLRHIATQQRDESGVLDAAAWYVYLLDQLGRGRQAVDAWLEMLHQTGPDQVLNDDVAPSLQQLVRRYQLYDEVGDELQQRGDLLGFATLVAARSQAEVQGD